VNNLYIYTQPPALTGSHHLFLSFSGRSFSYTSMVDLVIYFSILFLCIFLSLIPRKLENTNKKAKETPYKISEELDIIEAFRITLRTNHAFFEL